MSNIRIKDLTTTAATTASDDFVAVDGTTNGTRKLSAYSPSFGGNATVGGTLTVNGANSTLSASTGYAISKIYGPVGGYTDFYAANGTTRNGSVGCEAAGEMYLGTRVNQPIYTLINGSVVATQTSGTLTLAPTTASTTTSTGALVVGNGTSGGLGVGGSINCGGNATVTGTLTVNNPVVAQGTAITGYQFLAKDTGGTAVGAAYALQTSGGTDKWRWGLRGSAGSLTDSLIFSYLSGSWSDALTLSNAGVVSIPATTASTSTSSGALVVSGGVGVAGAGYFGGTVTIASNFSIASTGFYAGGGTPGAGRFLYSATAGTMLCAQTGSSYDLSLASATGTVILGNPTGTSNLEAAGSIKTAAPSGGTAAAWKLGTVATVSPTSPNRTIEVDIGGTIYYIHAKTTNN